MRRRPVLLIVGFLACWIAGEGSWSGANVANGQTWSERGPALGGRLSAIVAADGGKTLIVASPGGGVWRRTPGTAPAWKAVNSGLADYSVTHLEWDIVTPGRLYAMTWTGLFVSANNGDSWKGLINPGGTPAPIRPDLIVPVDPKPFAQMKFSPAQRVVLASPPCGGLWYSFNGTDFTQHWPFPGGSSNVDNCISTIAADPVSKRVYFSTMFWKPQDIPRVYRSNCDPGTWAPNTPCLTWDLVNDGLPQSLGVAAMTPVASPGSEYSLVVAVRLGNSAVAMYAFPDPQVAGPKWKWQTSWAGEGWDPRALVYAGSGKEMFHGNVWASHTLNFINWSPFKTGSEHPDTRAIHHYYDPGAGVGKVWTVTDGSGNKGDQGNVMQFDWKPGSKPTNGIDLGHARLTVWQAYYAGVVATQNPNTPSRVFVGAQDNAAICTDNVGKTWTHLAQPPAPYFWGGDVFVLQFSPTNPNRGYAWSSGGKENTFFRTSNAGSAATCADVKWEAVTPSHDPPNGQFTPPGYWSRNTIAVHPTNPDRLYFALQNNIGVSTNAGAATPLITHYQLPGDPAPLPSAIYVDSAGAIYVGTADRGAYKCEESGPQLTCTPWGLNGPSPASPAIVTAITRADGAMPTFWMATTKGLYKGTATGGPWTLTKAGPENHIVSDVKVDPGCSTRVYAAFGFGGWRAQHRGGIAVTSDGKTWTAITAGSILHNVPITDVEVDLKNPKVVYAATYGRGLWVYDWGAKLPACQP